MAVVIPSGWLFWAESLSHVGTGRDTERRAAAFVDGLVAAGRHLDASEVVAEALRRLQDEIEGETAEIEMILGIAEEGRRCIEQGDSVTIKTEDDKAALFARLTGRTFAALPPPTLPRG